ncbi:MAG: winged helix DNA-binding domain-containing protein [Gaiellaceae bacterium]
MAAPVLTARDLNRALLARQLLLERARLPLVRALERVAGIQAQYAPSAYVGLWSRLEGFALADLTRSLERRRAVQGTLMRSTIHLVSASDYWPFAAGTRASRRASWLRGHRRTLPNVDMDAAAAIVASELDGRVKSRAELLDALRGHDPSSGSALWNGVGAWIDLLRAPPSGTWERRRADLFVSAESWIGPSAVGEEQGLAHLLRRYLAAFGPAALADAASWAGVPSASLRPLAERLELRRLRHEDGTILLDLPRAPLPGGDAPAAPRLLPTWDATLLVHARRAQILPEPLRPLVFDTKTPHSVPVFLLDGAVAGSWRVERAARSATLALEPFDGVPAGEREPLRNEAERLLRMVEPDAASYAVRGAG